MKSGSLGRYRLFRTSLRVVLIGLIGTAFWIWMKNRVERLPFYTKTQEGVLEGLGHFGQVPDFSLIERSGRNLGLADLQGKVWIANFIYTHCSDSCPLQSARMAELQKDLSEEKEPVLSLSKDVRLVSISVDPERDTPEVLSEYAKRYGADPSRWFFLTGEKEAIYHLAQGGFHLSAVEVPSEEQDASGATYIHSSRFVLVDRQGQIRGYYHSTDSEALRRLLRDVRTLLQEKT